jgi:hypothetical protein
MILKENGDMIMDMFLYLKRDRNLNKIIKED